MNQDDEMWRLRNADATLRLFITAFLVVLTCGYAVGLFFVDHTTNGTPGGISAEFRGDEGDVDGTGMKFGKGLREMYTVVHNHLLSLSILFFIVGSVFYFTSGIPAGWKTFFLVEPFVAILTTFGGLWLLRLVSPLFVWLVIPSGISMAICYAFMTGAILKELWWDR
jgi:hypothetical protein